MFDVAYLHAVGEYQRVAGGEHHHQKRLHVSSPYLSAVMIMYVCAMHCAMTQYCVLNRAKNSVDHGKL